MAIQYKFFHMGVCPDPSSEAELNRFLRAHRVVQVHRQFVDCKENSFWSIAVEFMEDGKGRETDTHRSSGKSRKENIQ